MKSRSGFHNGPPWARSRLFLPALVLGVPVFARAEAPVPSDTTLPPIRVEGAPDDAAATQPRDTTPFAAELRPAEAAEPTLAAALAPAPGATVRRTGGHREELQLRGAGAGQIAVLLDDVPLTTARGGAFDLSLVPPEVVERAEVIRGPQGATYGGGALGGVLHLHTAPVAPGHSRTATLSLGQFETRGLRAAEAFGGQRYDVLALAGAEATAGDFFYVDTRGHHRQRQNNDDLRLHGLLRGRLRLGSDATVQALAFGLSDERGEPGVEQYEQKDARAVRRRALLAVALDAPTLLDGALAGTAQAFYTFDRDDFRDPSPALVGAPQDSRLTDRSVGGRAALTLTTFEDHLPRLALEVRHETAETELRATTHGGRDDSRTGGAAIVSEEYLLLGDRIVLAAALRLDARTGREPLPVPQAGVTVEPMPGSDSRLVLRANVGRVFRDPSFDELYFDAPGLQGDPTLHPESGLAWDAGGRYTPVRGVSVEAAAFGQKFDRLILFLPVQAQLIRATDDHAASIFGQEAGADLTSGPGRLQLAYTHLTTRFESAPRSPLPGRPAHRLYGCLTGKVGHARAFLAADGRSEIRTDRFGYRRLPGHTLWDLGLAGPLGGGFETALVLHNLTDRLDARDATQQPIPGRNWLLTLSWKG